MASVDVLSATTLLCLEFSVAARDRATDVQCLCLVRSVLRTTMSGDCGLGPGLSGNQSRLREGTRRSQGEYEVRGTSQMVSCCRHSGRD